MHTAAAAFVLGAIFGSFGNVLIYRIPRGESVVHPGSRCPACRKPIPWWENVPLLSFVLLRGRCSGCGASIPVRYPATKTGDGLPSKRYPPLPSGEGEGVRDSAGFLK